MSIEDQTTYICLKCEYTWKGLRTNCPHCGAEIEFPKEYGLQIPLHAKVSESHLIVETRALGDGSIYKHQTRICKWCWEHKHQEHFGKSMEVHDCVAEFHNDDGTPTYGQCGCYSLYHGKQNQS
jgi:hypothetical protein